MAGSEIMYTTKSAVLVEWMLTILGLPLPGDAQHMAPEPEIQRLQSTILRDERSRAFTVDFTLGPPARALHDRFHCLATTGYCIWCILL